MRNWLIHNLKNRTRENGLPLKVEFNFSPFSAGTFKEEARKVCVELYEKYGDKLFLAFSGGSDSEFILQTFLELNLPITPVIVSCPFNQFDIEAAFAYCKQHNLDPKVLQFGENYQDLARRMVYDKGLLSPIGLAPVLVHEYVQHFGGKEIGRAHV